jgi:hypothetical protein
MPARLLALVLVVVLVATLATPAKAEAIDPFTALAIAGVAVIVLVLVAYLVVANTSGGKRVEHRQPVWLACSSEQCVTFPSLEAPLPPPAATLSQESP